VKAAEKCEKFANSRYELQPRQPATSWSQVRRTAPYARTARTCLVAQRKTTSGDAVIGPEYNSDSAIQAQKSNVRHDVAADEAMRRPHPPHPIHINSVVRTTT